MQISSKEWNQYIQKLARINKRAGEEVKKYVETYGITDSQALIQYAYSVVAKYSEGAAELSCQMYDEIAEAQKQIINPAIPANIPEYGEVAKAVNGTKLNLNVLEGAMGRLVKRTAADTMLDNAKRDGAYFAWVPSGDTCAYCLTMAAIGWQKAGKKTLKGTHAEHIHANCNCNYVIDFKGDLEVEGYDPGKLRNQIMDAIGYDGENDDFDDYLRRMWDRSKGKRNNTDLNLLRQYLKEKNSLGLIKIPQIPASTILEKVENGEYSLKLSRQQYEKHIEGTKAYNIYKSSRLAKGDNEQSRLFLTFDETKDVIEKYCGTGIIRVRKDGTPINIEQVTCDKIIGEYWQKGEWIQTNKAAIHYGSKGTHVVPIKGKGYD